MMTVQKAIDLLQALPNKDAILLRPYRDDDGVIEISEITRTSERYCDVGLDYLVVEPQVDLYKNKKGFVKPTSVDTYIFN